jgi:hexokinase
MKTKKWKIKAIANKANTFKLSELMQMQNYTLKVEKMINKDTTQIFIFSFLKSY